MKESSTEVESYIACWKDEEHLAVVGFGCRECGTWKQTGNGESV